MITDKYSYKNIIKLALPITVAQVGNVLTGLTDTYFVSKLGVNEIAASGIANSVFFTTIVLCIGMMVSVSAIVAQAKSNQDTKQIGRIYHSVIWSSFVMGLLMNIIVLVLANNFIWFEQTNQVNKIAPDFLNIIGLSAIPMSIFIGLKNISDGYEDTRPGLIISLGALVLNAILNPIFIWGFDLGFNGSAWATLTSRIITAFAIWYYLKHNKKYADWHTKIPLKIWLTAKGFGSELNKLFKIGLPSGFQYLFEIAAFSGASAMMGHISNIAGASHQLAIQLAALTYMAATGISVAGSILTGSAKGNSDLSSIYVAGKRSLIIVGIWMSFTCLIFIIFNTSLVSLFNQNHDINLQTYAENLLIIAGFFQLSDGLQCVGLGILRGIGDTRVPTLITLIAYWVIGLPLGKWLGLNLGYGGEGIWWALFAGLTFSSIALNWRFFKLIKKH